MKYAIFSEYETNYDVQDGNDEMDYPFIVLTSKEYKEWMKVKEAYEMWQEKFSEAAYENTLKPREPFQTIEDVEREIREFLK
jgi:hypothetical protein